MTRQHSAVPPQKLVDEWTSLANEEDGAEVWTKFATWASQWGADQELEACCAWVDENTEGLQAECAAASLRSARRPEPASLKQEALIASADLSPVAQAAWTAYLDQSGIDETPADLPALAAALRAIAGSVPRVNRGGKYYAAGFHDGIAFSCQFLRGLASELDRASAATNEEN
jgi:hypothetical protein